MARMFERTKYKSSLDKDNIILAFKFFTTSHIHVHASQSRRQNNVIKNNNKITNKQTKNYEK